MTVIALTRESGTQGDEIAAAVGKRLGFDIVHHQLIEHDIADRTGLSESDVHHQIEDGPTVLERLLFDRRGFLKHAALEILEQAARGNIVLRGWGAPSVLSFVPHVLCVRICAPMSFREAVLIERRGSGTPSAARRELERSDAAHNGAMQTLFGSRWDDPLHYALVLNTARVPVDDCVEVIVRLATSGAFQETPYSRDVLMDRLILHRVQVALEQEFGAKSIRNGIEPHVVGRKVLLTGGSTDEDVIAEAVRVVQRVEGVRGVESKVAYVAFQPPLQ